MNSSGTFYRLLKQKTQTINDGEEIIDEYGNYKDLEDDAQFDTGKSIQETYDDAEIATKTIVRTEGATRAFYVYDSVEALYRDIVETNSWHEVGLAGKRKLYFDIDMSAKDTAEFLAIDHPLVRIISMAPEDSRRIAEYEAVQLSPAVRRYLDRVIRREGSGYSPYAVETNEIAIIGECLARSLIEYLMELYPHVYILRCNSFVINADFQKFSIHLIVGLYAHTSYEIAQIAGQIFESFCAQSEFHRWVGRFIDMGVYGPVRSLRLTGTTKYGQNPDRVKRLVNALWETPFDNWRHTLITHIDCTCDRVIHVPIKPGSKFKGFDAVEISHLPEGFMKIIAPYSEGLEPVNIWGSMVYFRRIRPSLCQICQRTHEKDNSLFVLIGEQYYVVKCRRDQRNRKIFIKISSVIQLRPIPRGIEVLTDDVVGGEIVADGSGKKMKKRRDTAVFVA